MTEIFKNSEGDSIAASIFGSEDNPLVILLHGGRQTRFTWRKEDEIV